jgi:PAS domain S-box-containing protein
MKPSPDFYHSARILIVDDEQANRRLLEVMLGQEGFQLLTAASGEEALALVAREPPDLILLDVMMPGMDGYAVASALKANHDTKNIPIIVVTALDDREAMMRGLSAGAEDFLSKPVDRSELHARVRNLLRLKAYGDYYDKYSQILEGEVAARTADLEERTKALEQQAAVVTELAGLLDLAQDAIIVRDMDNRILFWNYGAEVLYGWTGEEALGRNLGQLLNAELSPLAASLDATILDRGRWEGELIHHRRDGARVAVSSRWGLQRDSNGAPLRILTINRDLTDHGQAASR